MPAEILKGYRIRKGNRRKLLDSLLALWKYSWLENGQLLAKKSKDHYRFLLSFLSEPEAERFEENFQQDPSSKHVVEFTLSEDSEDQYAPIGEVLPSGLSRELTERFSQDPDVMMDFVRGPVERDEQDPEEEYVFQLPEDVKEAYREYREKHKPS